jgi:hypothetical protein
VRSDHPSKVARGKMNPSADPWTDPRRPTVSTVALLLCIPTLPPHSHHITFLTHPRYQVCGELERCSRVLRQLAKPEGIYTYIRHGRSSTTTRLQDHCRTYQHLADQHWRTGIIGTRYAPTADWFPPKTIIHRLLPWSTLGPISEIGE